MLTNKQRVFIAEYVKDFNATRAAIAAGYSERSAADIGWENLRKPDISVEIEKQIAHRSMTKSEVLTRLTEQARGSIGDFVSVHEGKPYFDFSAAEGRMHLIRKLKTKTKTYNIPSADPENDETVVSEVEVDVELYDAQSALVHLGRHHKLFTDRQEVAGDKDNPLWIEVNAIDYRNGLTDPETRSIPDSEASGES